MMPNALRAIRLVAQLGGLGAATGTGSDGGGPVRTDPPPNTEVSQYHDAAYRPSDLTAAPDTDLTPSPANPGSTTDPARHQPRLRRSSPRRFQRRRWSRSPAGPPRVPGGRARRWCRATPANRPPRPFPPCIAGGAGARRFTDAPSCAWTSRRANPGGTVVLTGTGCAPGVPVAVGGRRRRGRDRRPGRWALRGRAHPPGVSRHGIPCSLSFPVT